MSDRFRDFQGTLHREAADLRVLVVTHGDFMGIARYNIERMLPEQCEDVERDESQDVKNCAIFHYSRVNPADPGDIRDKLSFRPLVNPTDAPSSPFGVQWSGRRARGSRSPSCCNRPGERRGSSRTSDGERAQSALRFLRLTPTLPHSEKPRMVTCGAPGEPWSPR